MDSATMTIAPAHERIQEICDKIRLETLEPAKAQAQQILDDANRQADQIRAKAREEAAQLLQTSKQQLDEERRIFTASLAQASKQALEALRQQIQTALLGPALDSWIVNQCNGSATHAQLITALVNAIEASGLRTNLQLVIPKTLSADEVLRELAPAIAERLRDGIQVGSQRAGIQLHLVDKHLTFDLSDMALKEIMNPFVSKAFRALFYG